MANTTFAWMVDRCRPFLAFNDDIIHRVMDGYITGISTMLSAPDAKLQQLKDWDVGKETDPNANMLKQFVVGSQVYLHPDPPPPPIHAL